MTPRLSRSPYHASGGNDNGTIHEIEQPRWPDRVYRYHAKSESCQLALGKGQIHFSLILFQQSLHKHKAPHVPKVSKDGR